MINRVKLTADKKKIQAEKNNKKTAIFPYNIEYLQEELKKTTQSFPRSKLTNKDILIKNEFEIPSLLRMTSRKIVMRLMTYEDRVKFKALPSDILDAIIKNYFLDTLECLCIYTLMKYRKNNSKNTYPIVNLSELKTIEISTKVYTPPEIYLLPKLKKITFANNLLKNIPKALFLAKNLTIINLSNTGITWLPKDFFSSFPCLSELFLSENKIRILSKTFSEFKPQAHFRLFIDKNSITSLPGNSGLTALDISGNTLFKLRNITQEKFPMLKAIKIDCPMEAKEIRTLLNIKALKTIVILYAAKTHGLHKLLKAHRFKIDLNQTKCLKEERVYLKETFIQKFSKTRKKLTL